MIFRRRRIRIEIEENTLTLGLVQPPSVASSPKKAPASVAPLLLPSSSTEPNLPRASEGKSTPEGSPHVR